MTTWEDAAVAAPRPTTEDALVAAERALPDGSVTSVDSWLVPQAPTFTGFVASLHA